MSKGTCFFCECESEVERIPQFCMMSRYICKYCGKYLLDDDLLFDFPEIKEVENKFKIACVLNEMRTKGCSGIALDDETDYKNKVMGYPRVSIREILDDFPKKPNDLINRSMLNLSRLNPSKPFDTIQIDMTNSKDNLYSFMSSKKECFELLHELSDQGFIRFNEVQSGIQIDSFVRRGKFWQAIEDLQSTEKPQVSSFKKNTPKDWDIFISHASEDKDDFVRPLAEALINNGLKVWFDETTLKIGDSLRRTIDHGLAQSRYGVVVLSENFLKKDWPQRELDGLTSLEIDERKVILPIWHNISKEEVMAYSPILADRLATNSSDGLDKVVKDILAVI